MGTPTGDAWRAVRRRGTSTAGARTPLRQRWAVWAALAAGIAMGVAGVLSFGPQAIRVPPAVVLQLSNRNPPSATAGAGGAFSGGPHPRAARTGEGRVTVVTATPPLVVESSDGQATGSGGATNDQQATTAAPPAGDQGGAGAGSDGGPPSRPGSGSADGGDSTPTTTPGSGSTGSGSTRDT